MTAAAVLLSIGAGVFLALGGWQSTEMANASVGSRFVSYLIGATTAYVAAVVLAVNLAQSIWPTS
jgi:hypothetical protein